MSLRVRLSLIISVLFLLGMILGVSFQIHNAKQRVAAEVESTATLTYQLLDAILTDPGNALISRNHTLLLQKLLNIENARHMDISIVTEGSSQVDGMAEDREINAPAWFVRLVRPEPLEYVRAINNTSREVIIIRTNPADEIAEVYRESKYFLAVLLLVLLTLNSILYITIGRWLKPVDLIVEGLEDAEHGDFSGHISHASLPELKIIVEKLNQLTNVLRISKAENDRLTKRSLIIQEGLRLLSTKIIKTGLRCIIMLSLSLGGNPLLAQGPIDEILVIGVTPGSAMGQNINNVPFPVQSAHFADLENSQSLDLSDFMNSTLSSVNINSAQSNPLQPDVQYRGFTASPLLGLPQGISVYQNGVRINEPLGDSVNWDLLPESAIYSMDLISGANPVFGLNTLGGALAINMKNGFNFEGHQLEAYTGSWGRVVGNFESGGNNSNWGYYLNISHFQENGWRQLSESEATSFYGSMSWRNSERTAMELIYQQGMSELIGNGSLPAGLLAIQRDAIFTAPDITDNDMRMLNFESSHFINDSLQVSGNVFWRENTTDAFNGDGSEFESCEFFGGNQALFEEADDVEDALEALLAIGLDDICEGNDPGISSFAELEGLIEQRAAQAGLDPETFELENVIDELSGTGIITDQAINNISKRKQQSRGLTAQVAILADLFSYDNRFIAGFSYFKGESDFSSVLELANLDPVTRSTRSLGVGTFLDTAATDIYTGTETFSWYFTDTLNLGERLSLTLAGRYNDTDINLRDRSGERPELNGDHSFARFNPSLGFTYTVSKKANIYGSYSESNRVPTPIELACNEGVFELARQFAINEGEDPDHVDFECRLPNAFLADPPLEDVVTRNFELGMRGVFKGLSYHVGVFNATNTDDIIFQTTGRATGLFANVDKTRRRGIESMVKGRMHRLDGYASYSFIEATFEDDFMVLSPNHPHANQQGELAVQSGDRLPGLPEHIFKLGGDYHFNENLSIGAELIYNSNQVIRGDEANELEKIDGYTIANLRASYNFGENLSVFARVTNAFDREYENFGLLGEDPGAVLPGLADNRPLFLGAGAPRGAWAGVRYRF